MKWPAMLALSAVVVGLGGCDKIPNIPFLSKKKPAAAPDSAAMVAAASQSDTTTPAPPPPQPAPQKTAAPRAQALTDAPWTPVDTGTVDPGMTHDQVVAVWGVPVAERTFGERTFLYFRNGCEVTCGTFDVVFLDNGQVVDAIVRGRGHTYSGVSSSPPDRKAEATKPGAPPGAGDAGG